MELHRFLHDQVYVEWKKQYNKNEFDNNAEDQAAFDEAAKFQDYNDGSGNFAYWSARCSAGVEVVDEDHSISKAEVFASSKNRRNWNNWLQTMRRSIDNPCMLVC